MIVYVILKIQKIYVRVPPWTEHTPHENKYINSTPRHTPSRPPWVGASFLGPVAAGRQGSAAMDAEPYMLCSGILFDITLHNIMTYPIVSYYVTLDCIT